MEFPLFLEAYTIYKDNSLSEPANIAAQQHGMIRGLLETSGDPYTIFLAPPENELQTNQLEGKFGGVGVRIDRNENGDPLLYPLPGSPALKAGIQDGDRLLRVDQLDVSKDTNLDEIQAAIRGPINSTVTISVQRLSDSFEFNLRRTEVAVPSVTYNLYSDDARIGVVQVSIIAATTPDEISSAIDKLKGLGASHFILDLRNNGGGLVEGGVNSARLFLPAGLVVAEEKFREESVESFKSTTQGKYSDTPLAIVVNQNTASAAEILAGSLQVHQRAILIGCQTFGKYSVQKIFTLSDESSIHVTAGKWWLPGQETNQAPGGLEPEILLSQAEAASTVALQKAADILIP
jgi:carboxyl-terminal processing protease